MHERNNMVENEAEWNAWQGGLSLDQLSSRADQTGRHSVRYEEVMWLWDEMRSRYGIQPDLGAYNLVLRCCKRAGQWERAEELLLEVRRDARAACA